MRRTVNASVAMTAVVTFVFIFCGCWNGSVAVQFNLAVDVYGTRLPTPEATRWKGDIPAGPANAATSRVYPLPARFVYADCLGSLDNRRESSFSRLLALPLWSR